MPSVKEMCILNNSSNNTSNSSTQEDFLSKDMEKLVSEIKENLKLSNLKVVKHTKRTVRNQPYSIPNRSLNDTECSLNQSCSSSKCQHSGTSSKMKKQAPDDPYEMLQELLKDGSLIKEAVRRLQISPKQRHFYESEDDSRSSPHPNLDFVC